MHIHHLHKICDIAIAAQWSCNFWHIAEGNHCQTCCFCLVLWMQEDRLLASLDVTCAIVPAACVSSLQPPPEEDQKNYRNHLQTQHAWHRQAPTTSKEPMADLRTLPCLHKWSTCPFSAVVQWHGAESLRGQDYWWRPGLLFWQPIAQSRVRWTKCPWDQQDLLSKLQQNIPSDAHADHSCFVRQLCQSERPPLGTFGVVDIAHALRISISLCCIICGPTGSVQ